MCLQLDSSKSPSEKIYVTVTLNVESQVIYLFRGYRMSTSSLSCYKFMVPPPKGTEEVGTVKIEGTGEAPFSQSKNVLIRRITNGVVIQTDKPTYRASHTVFLRILSISESFHIAQKKYDLIELRDPKSTCIAQWRNIGSDSGLVNLSFKLSDDPPQGTYTFNVNNGQTLKTFIVNQNVLPRFEVTIENPTTVFKFDNSFDVKVCCRYTYGKRVDGLVTVNICPSYHRKQNAICVSAEGQTDSSGCFSKAIETNLISGYASPINITALVEDAGTGVTFTASKIVPISFVSGTLMFENMASYYKEGYPYRITLVMQNNDGTPVPLVSVTLQITLANWTISRQTPTNDMGKIYFELDTSEWSGTVNLVGYYKTNLKVRENNPDYSSAYHSVQAYFSAAQSIISMSSVSGVILCGRSVTIHVDYQLERQDLKPGATSVNFTYVVIGRTGIWANGQKAISLKKANSLRGSFAFSMIFTSAFAPAPKMIGYILLNDGAVAADKLHFSVEKCFPNKVYLKFPVTETLPKTSMDLTLQALENSTCGLRVVDKSTQISYANQELTPDKIYSLFSFLERSGYDYRVDELQPNPCGRFSNFQEEARSLKRPSNRNDKYMDILSLIKTVGIKILTNARIQKPMQDGKCTYPLFFVADDMAIQRRPEKPEPLEAGTDTAVKVREFFPETWLWSLVNIGKTRQARLKVTVPDTITDWIGGILCIGMSGFGFSPPASLRVFKPFFVEMSLPYSVVRGEMFTLKATVFNFMGDCIKIQVSLTASLGVQVAACPQCQNSSCVCSDRSVLFKWNVTARNAGMVTFTVRADAVASTELCEGKNITQPTTAKTDIERRQLLVKPGGIKKEITESFFYCLKDSNEDVSGSFSLQIPSSVVEDSVSAYVAVMGDPIGSALQNLDNLIQMPYGCGEQNMLTTSVIVYVLQYLEATGQLNPELRSKAISYLQSGYQRQLNYKHIDSSFSAFGMSDGEGSTWLTAFVVMCFSEARNYIFIDENMLSEAVTWLSSLQEPGGCFLSKGRVIHTPMKGGVQDDLSLSAYVTAALLIFGTPKNDDVLVNALNCLRQELSSLSNPYTMALMAYVFSLADDMTNRAILLEKLYELAVTADGGTYWVYTQQSGTVGGLSAEVELTSYVLLSHVSVQNVNSADIVKASEIVKWLVRKQNPNGGYSSTQDTVVAIHALTKYLRLTFSDQMDITVNVTGSYGFAKQFHVDKDNSLLQQRETLPSIPGHYTFYVSGRGCVLIQSVLKCNIYPVARRSAFHLIAYLSPPNCNKQGLQQLQLNISLSYTGSRNATNMIVIEVEMQSGYSPAIDPVTTNQFESYVKKVTTSPTSITIYLEKLTSEVEVFSLNIEQNFIVRNVKPASIKVYDYYLPEERSESSYTASTPCP